MTQTPEIAINSFGDDDHRIVVVDNFHPDAEALRTAAQASRFGAARNLYPGIRAPLPDDYWSPAQIALCKGAISRAFSLSGSVHVIDSSFSIVTTACDTLSDGQRLPHFDAIGARQFALVHYLSERHREGTAFFRHRSTGLAAIAEADRHRYFAALEAELQRCGPPAPGYVCGDTPLFEQIHLVGARFNRAVLYRGQQLHSGAIGPDALLSAEPLAGRLTVTAFMTIW